MKEIDSSKNRTLTEVRKIRDGRHPGLFFVEGVRLFEELTRSELIVRSVFFDRESDSLSKLAFQSSDSELYSCTSKAIRSICDTKNPQGIAAVVERPASDPDLLKRLVSFSERALLIFLERVGNPGNLGSVIRTAEAAGVSAVLLSAGSSDPFSPAAVRGSMGSVFRTPVFRDVELGSIKQEFADALVRIYGTTGGEGSVLGDFEWSPKSLICFGSEAHGLSAETLGLTDERVKIPMKGKVESLNLAVSAGIVLFNASSSFQD